MLSLCKESSPQSCQAGHLGNELKSDQFADVTHVRETKQIKRYLQSTPTNNYIDFVGFISTTGLYCGFDHHYQNTILQD